MSMKFKKGDIVSPKKYSNERYIVDGWSEIINDKNVYYVHCICHCDNGSYGKVFEDEISIISDVNDILKGML